jgi:lysophospholipase L1-like esterase
MSQDKSVSATGSYAATFTQGPSGAWSALMATFKSTVGGGGGGGTQPPTGTISSPTGNVTIAVGGAVNFAGSGTDPQGLALTYDWNFGGAGIPDSTQQNPGLVQFGNPGTFTVTLTVTDSAGLSDPAPPTRNVTVQANSFSALIPQNVFSLSYVDSQETTVAGCCLGQYAFDGNPATAWHTQWVNTNPPLPHEIQVNLGGMYDMNGFHYLPNQDTTHGWIGQFEFYVSKDGINWGNPVATGTFPNSGAEQDVAFAPTVGHYVRLRDIANIFASQPWTSVAELNLTRFCASTPSVMLSSPWNGYLQSSSTLTAKAQACLDPTTQANWGVQFVLDGTTTINSFTAPFQATFVNLSRAEHTVDAYIIDNSGNRISGTATHDHAFPVGVGDYYVTMGDSITYGIGDNYAADNTSNDGRNTGGGYEPILNNLLTTAKGYPQTVINEGVPGTTSLDGLNLIPWLLPKHSQVTKYLIMFGMNDAAPWMPVPSGLGLNPGDAGYAGTFKDHMQQIISQINAAGKRAALAKVNVALADCADNVPTDPGYCPPYSNLNSGARNVLIQQYNQVVDELRGVTSNSITVVPPDFYSYFSANYNGQYWDNIHPNGVGYQSMGNLWYQALR